jgi:hypothetical protein
MQQTNYFREEEKEDTSTGVGNKCMKTYCCAMNRRGYHVGKAPETQCHLPCEL